MECHLRRVNFMVGTVIYISVNTKYRESTQNTGFRCFLDTLADSRDILLRNRTADYAGFILECLFSVRIHGLELNFTMSVLSTSTGLLRIFVFLINRFGKCLFISNLRSAYVSLYFVFTKQTVYDNLQMQLAHTCDDRLSCLLIRMSTECRIFFCKFRQSFTHLALTCLGLRLDRQLDNRLREFHGL